MPKEGELFNRKRSLNEINTQIHQQETLQDQNMTTVQGQMMQNMHGTVNGGAAIQVIGADQFAQAPEQQFSGGALDFSVEGSVECENDSSRMKSIRAAVGSYFSKKTEYDASAEGSRERAITARELIREAEAIISSCKWYCFFRHPFTKRGIARKNEVKELRRQVEDTVHSLRLETINIIHKNKNEQVLESTRKVELREKKNGEKELVFGGKEMTYEASDRIRLNQKEYLKALVTEDNRNRKSSWSKDIRDLLRYVREYADIHTTAMHLRTAIRMSNSKEASKDVKGKYRKKIEARSFKLNQERGYVCAILNCISQIDQSRLTAAEKEIIKRYKDYFVNMISGTLKVDEDAETIDVTDKKDKVIFRKREGLKQDPVEVRVTDLGQTPLFSHEPCTQDIAQNRLGDCYFLTSLSQVVKDDPGAIRSIMKDNGDSVTVRFFAYAAQKTMKPVYVKVPKISVSYGAIGAVWVQIMELAYAAYMQKKIEKENPEAIPKDGKLDLGYMGNGGQEIDVYEAIYGKQDFEIIGIDRPTVLDDPEIMSDTSQFAGIITSNSGETALILNEERELTEKYGEFNDLYTKNFKLEGEMRENADPKEVELCKILFEKKKELFNKTMNQSVNVFYDELQEKYSISFKEINEKLRKINDKWIKTVPEAKELLERRYQIRKVLLPKAKKDSDEYNSLVKERDRLNKELKQKGILDQMAFSSQDLIPGETMRDYFYNKQKQISMLNDDSNNLVSIIRKKLGLRSGNATDQIRGDYGKILETLRKADYKEYKGNEQIFSHMLVTPYNTGDVEADKKEAFELIRYHAIKVCELAYNNLQDAINEKQSQLFTGEYSQSVKNTYDRIKSCIDSGKRVSADTRLIEGGTDSVGTYGEKMRQGVVGRHAYSIMDAGEFDYDGKKILMVKVRNPWAGFTCKYTVDKNGKVISNDNNNKTNGEFWMDMTHFAKKFFQVTYEK